jgi:hypothetical protein
MPPGLYEVQVYYIAGSARASRAPYDVNHIGGVTRVFVDQTTQPSFTSFLSLGLYAYNLSLGVFQFDGSPGNLGVTVNSDSGLNVATDAVRFICRAPNTVLSLNCSGSTNTTVDNRFAAVSSGWTIRNNSNVPHVDATYITSNYVANLTVFFPFGLLGSGSYDVRVFFAAGLLRSRAVPHVITHAAGTTVVYVDQTVQPPLESYLPLGIFAFDTSIPGQGVAVQSGPTGLNAAADAVRFNCL